MASSIMQWPHELLIPATLTWHIDGGYRSGGRSLAETELRSDTTGGGFWRTSMQNIRQLSREQIMSYRALIARCRQGIAPIIVPVIDEYKPFSGQSPGMLSETPFSSGEPYSSGQQHLVTHIESSFYADAEVGDTRVRITRENSAMMANLQSGEYFSVDHSVWGRRLYMVLEIEESSSTGNTWWVWIAPRLREDVVAGQLLDFATPSCQMVLANPREAAQTIESPFIGSGSPVFVEHMPPRS